MHAAIRDYQTLGLTFECTSGEYYLSVPCDLSIRINHRERNMASIRPNIDLCIYFKLVQVDSHNFTKQVLRRFDTFQVYNKSNILLSDARATHACVHKWET